jgi:hypothetical protein
LISGFLGDSLAKETQPTVWFILSRLIHVGRPGLNQVYPNRYATVVVGSRSNAPDLKRLLWFTTDRSKLNDARLLNRRGTLWFNRGHTLADQRLRANRPNLTGFQRRNRNSAATRHLTRRRHRRRPPTRQNRDLIDTPIGAIRRVGSNRGDEVLLTGSHAVKQAGYGAMGSAMELGLPTRNSACVETPTEKLATAKVSRGHGETPECPTDIPEPVVYMFNGGDLMLSFSPGGALVEGWSSLSWETDGPR